MGARRGCQTRSRRPRGRKRPRQSPTLASRRGLKSRVCGETPWLLILTLSGLFRPAPAIWGQTRKAQRTRRSSDQSVAGEAYGLLAWARRAPRDQAWQSLWTIAPLSRSSIFDLFKAAHSSGEAVVFYPLELEPSQRYHALIARFERLTDCPVLVNTSFNVRGEPIVCPPEDAFACLNQTDGCASQFTPATRIPGIRFSMYSSSNEARRWFANDVGWPSPLMVSLAPAASSFARETSTIMAPPSRNLWTISSSLNPVPSR